MSEHPVLVAVGTSLCTRLLVHYLQGREGIGSVSGARSLEEARELSWDTSPGVIVVEIETCAPRGPTSSVAEWVEAFPDSRVLVLGGNCDEQTIAQALEEGACGYVCTCESEETVHERIVEVARGEFAVDGNISRSVLLNIRRRSATDFAAELRVAAQADMGITEREFEVLGLVAEGMTNRQIGVSLGIAESTVKNHLNSLFEKMGVSCRSQAVSQGVRLGILDLS